MKYIVLPIIAALIGWFTNYVAIKLMFRPVKPYIILGMSLQGVIPKRRGELASTIGQVVESQLVSTVELFESFLDDDRKEDIVQSIRDLVKIRIQDYLPFFLPSGLRDYVSSYIDDIIKKESRSAIDELTEKYKSKIVEEIIISKMIEEKINNFDMLELERLIISVAKKELKHIEYLGGLIGFLIGLIQSLFIYYLS